MDASFMAQFVSFVNLVDHRAKVASAVSYPVPLIPVLTRPSTHTLVTLLLYRHASSLLMSYSTVDFGYNHEINPVTIFSSGSGIAGDTYSLTCSATLFIPIPLPSNIPSPTFQWSFCPPNFNPNLPSGVSPMGTTSSSNSTSITYTSTLQFSPLSQSHTGNYTCRLGAGSLVNNATVAGKIMNLIVSFIKLSFSTLWYQPSLSKSQDLLVELQ